MSEQKPVAWIDEYGNVFPPAAHSTDGKPLSWAHAYKRRWKPLFLAAPPAQPAQRLTDAQIKQAVTAAVKSGDCPWMGYEKDENGHYTLPSLSSMHYGIARAIEAAILGKE